MNQQIMRQVAPLALVLSALVGCTTDVVDDENIASVEQAHVTTCAPDDHICREENHCHDNSFPFLNPCTGEPAIAQVLNCSQVLQVFDESGGFHENLIIEGVTITLTPLDPNSEVYSGGSVQHEHINATSNQMNILSTTHVTLTSESGDDVIHFNILAKFQFVDGELVVENIDVRGARCEGEPVCHGELCP